MASKLERVLHGAVVETLEKTRDIGQLTLGILTTLESKGIQRIPIGLVVVQADDGNIFLASVSGRIPHRRGVKLLFSEQLEMPHKPKEDPP